MQRFLDRKMLKPVHERRRNSRKWILLILDEEQRPSTETKKVARLIQNWRDSNRSRKRRKS